MSARIKDIIVGNRFRKDLGNLAPLMASIAEVGLLHPIVITDDYHLIAGQRRLEAFKKMGAKTIPVNFLDLEDIVRGEFHENVVREDFTSRETIAIKRVLEPRFKEQALKREKAGKKAPSGKLPEGKGETREKLASFLNMGYKTLEKLEDVVDAAEAQPEQFGELPERIDRKSMSVDQAAKYVIETKKREALQAQEPTVKLPKGFKLYHGDFMQIPWEYEKVDLIFTDPPYGQDAVPVYGDLARMAQYCLKPGGSLVCFVGHVSLESVILQIAEATPEGKHEDDLRYWWIFAMVHSGPTSKVFARNVIAKFKPLLWYVKGDKPTANQAIRDVIISEKPDKSLHGWAQSTVEAEYIINCLTLPGQVVKDPFMGSGTTGIAALNCKRQFIGIELDHDHYRTAKSRIGGVKP